jgi:hypothetical protein
MLKEVISFFEVKKLEDRKTYLSKMPKPKEKFISSDKQASHYQVHRQKNINAQVVKADSNDKAFERF